MDSYQPQNQGLLTVCLRESQKQTSEPLVLDLLQKALNKSIKGHVTRPVPPLYAWLVAEDLEAQQPWMMSLVAACGFFYAAADLFDDIQDRDSQQPVIEASCPAQAINIANLLLTCSQKLILDLPLAAEIRIRLLRLFTLSCQTMSIGQFFDIHSTNLNSLEIQPESVFPKKAGAEFACFVSAVPLALGLIQDTDADNLFLAYQGLGASLGSQLQIFTDFFDIWVPQGTGRLSQDLAIYKNSFPLYWARRDPVWRDVVEAWLAGSATTAQRQFQLRRLLAQTQTLEQFANYLEQVQAEVASLFLTLPALPRIQMLWAEDCRNSRVLLDTLFELRAKTRINRQAADRTLPLQPALDAATEYLTFVPGYVDAWEVQRSGFLDEPLLLGNLFNPLLILESLCEAGHEIGPELKSILNRRFRDGWHYYTNSHKIPPDSDDLGQILHLIGRQGFKELEPALASSLQLLEANLEPSGFCPTWLCDEKVYKRKEVSSAWYGNDCCGVMANLYFGLACYDQPRYAKQIQQGAHYLLAHFDDNKVQWPAAHYPSYLYVAYLVARLFKLLDLRPACLKAVEARVLAEQSLDGSWFQQAQSTAFALLFLFALPREQQILSLPAQKKALSYLLDTQEYDGSWRAEALFVRPGKAAAFEVFAHPKLSTAFVVRALAQGRRQIESGFELEAALKCS